MVLIKVLFESQPLLGQRTGIGRYVEKLTNGLNRSRAVELFYWFNQPVNRNRIDKIDTPEKLIRNSYYPYKYLRRLMKPNLLHDFPVDMFESFDIFHGGNFLTYQTRKAKNVLTIHDLAFLKFPEVASKKTYRHHSVWLPYSIERADHIIADSLQTKQDIIECYNVPEKRISVIHLAADSYIKRADHGSINQTKIKYNLPDQYLLYVGTIEPRKNIPFLLEGYAQAKKQYKLNHKLVIAGSKGWKYEKVYETIECYKLENDIIFTGYVDNEDLPAIYSGASLFLFPSLYEGFGLPVLEAMQCGVPIIASDKSSLPEVVGDAGRLVSLDKKEEFIDSIGELLSNESKRKEYAHAGLERARKFSWERVAEETIEVYRKLL